ncbi:MAG: zinc/manganese transport system substrate-binding protein [Thermoleophilaceae bacterium]|jgi:zinc/manganese transport system substrate-binding protein|nr:zinc/manganese transport system substrate-binding protein [Thermoleophilaceae bacterium]
MRGLAPALATALLVVSGGALSACGGASSRAGGRVRVVAAENFYGDIVARVGGGHVDVTSIIHSPTADPHEYTGTTQDTEAVAHARLVIVNGAGYDSFMERLLAAAPSSGRTAIHVDDLLGVAGGDPNPHLWYDPRTAPRLGDAVARALTKADPAHSADYRRGASRFTASLAPIDREVASLRRFAGTPFAYTERVPEYLTRRIGLVLRTPPAFAKADEAGVDPPPQSVAAMRALVTGHRVKLLLYNAQADSPAAASVRSLAKAEGIPVVGVTETPPPHVGFVRWQLGQLIAIKAALSRP